MRRAILAALAGTVLSAGITYAPAPHAAPAHLARPCLTTPAGMYHRPMAAGHLAWAGTLAFLPRCAGGAS